MGLSVVWLGSPGALTVYWLHQLEHEGGGGGAALSPSPAAALAAAAAVCGGGGGPGGEATDGACQPTSCVLVAGS